MCNNIVIKDPTIPQVVVLHYLV